MATTKAKARPRPRPTAHKDPKPQAQPPEIVLPVDEEADELESLGKELVAVARDKTKREGVLEKIDELLSGLETKDLRALMDHPVVMKFIDLRASQMIRPTDPPGTTYFKNGVPFTKKPWTESDLKKSDIPIVTFEAKESGLVQWNGIRRYYEADKEYTDYACFRDLLAESRRLKRFAEDHKRFMFDGAPMAHPDMADPATMLVRATATGGSEYVGNGSLNAISVMEEAESGA